MPEPNRRKLESSPAYSKLKESRPIIFGIGFKSSCEARTARYRSGRDVVDGVLLKGMQRVNELETLMTR